MRKVLAYRLEAEECPLESLEELERRVFDWLEGKCRDGVPAEDGAGLILRNGRAARLARTRWRAEDGRALSTFVLTEETKRGEFRTSLAFGRSAAGKLAVFALLEAGQQEDVLAPLHVEARCPRVVRGLLEDGPPGEAGAWQLGPTVVECAVRRLHGSEGGRRLADSVRDPERRLPLVVISEDSGFLLHPGVDEMVLRDLLGLATVVVIEGEASWELTRRLGQTWSCFNGAVRIYWPGAGEGSDPFHHPLWTAGRLLERGQTTERAARDLARELRRRVYGAAAFSIRRPPLISELERARRSEEFGQRLEQVKEAKDFGLALSALREQNDAYELKILELTEENEELLEQLDRALTERDNAREELAFLRSDSGEGPALVSPEREVPPQDLAEAVRRARDELSADLVFGGDVDRGVRGLAANAGPPDKVLRWLRRLAEAARLKRSGGLGQDLHEWLRSRGLRVSGEARTVRNSDEERAKRTWNDGSRRGRRFFSDHLKPTQATAPDRCVRIYFAWDKGSRRFAIGWIGRHP